PTQPTKGSNQQGFYLSLRPKGGESSDIEENINATVFNSKIALSAQAEAEGNQAQIQIQSHEVDLKTFETFGDPLGPILPHREVRGGITEIGSERKEAGEYRS